MKLFNVLISGISVLKITVPSHGHSLRGKLPSYITPTEMIPAPCSIDDQCVPTIRSQAPAPPFTAPPFTGVGMCECYAASTTHPFDECEGNGKSCRIARCASSPCYNLEAYCDIRPGETTGQCTLPIVGTEPDLPSSSSEDSNHGREEAAAATEIPASCSRDDQCTPTIRSRASYPVTGVDPCECYAASTTHPFDECEGNEYQCAMFRCASDNFDTSCYNLEAYCDIKSGDTMGQCTLPTVGRSTPRLPPSSSADDDSHPNFFSIEGTNWLAEELYVDGHLEPALDTEESPLPIMLEFGSELNDDSTLNLSGQTGCNQFDGGYDLLFGIDILPQFRAEQPTINVQRGCHNDIMRQERAFMELLRQDAIIFQISTDGEELRLYDVAVAANGRQTQGNLMALFSRYPYRSRLVSFSNNHVMPIGSNWEAKSIRGIDELVVSTDDEPITMIIDAAPDSEGFRVSGYARGCNWYNGELEFLPVPIVDGMPLFLINISQVSSTRRGCFDDASIKQKRLFLGMLRQESPLAYTIRRILPSPDDIHTTIGEELSLYSVNIDEHGNQYRGELLAQFHEIPPPTSESSTAKYDGVN